MFYNLCKIKDIKLYTETKGRSVLRCLNFRFLLFIIQLKSCQEAFAALLVGIQWLDDTTGWSIAFTGQVLGLWRMWYSYRPSVSMGFPFRTQTSPEAFCNS